MWPLADWRKKCSDGLDEKGPFRRVFVDSNKSEDCKQGLASLTLG
jgi:hypothetical protein